MSWKTNQPRWARITSTNSYLRAHFASTVNVIISQITPGKSERESEFQGEAPVENGQENSLLWILLKTEGCSRADTVSPVWKSFWNILFTVKWFTYVLFTESGNLQYRARKKRLSKGNTHKYKKKYIKCNGMHHPFPNHQITLPVNFHSKPFASKQLKGTVYSPQAPSYTQTRQPDV